MFALISRGKSLLSCVVQALCLLLSHILNTLFVLYWNKSLFSLIFWVWALATSLSNILEFCRGRVFFICISPHTGCGAFGVSVGQRLWVSVCICHTYSMCTHQTGAELPLYPACILLGCNSSPVLLSLPYAYSGYSSLSECWSPHCVICLVAFKEPLAYLDVLKYSKLGLLKSRH